MRTPQLREVKEFAQSYRARVAETVLEPQLSGSGVHALSPLLHLRPPWLYRITDSSRFYILELFLDCICSHPSPKPLSNLAQPSKPGTNAISFHAKLFLAPPASVPSLFLIPQSTFSYLTIQNGFCLAQELGRHVQSLLLIDVLKARGILYVTCFLPLHPTHTPPPPPPGYCLAVALK